MIATTDTPLAEAGFQRMVAALAACGFRYVPLDLQGYRLGSFNAPPPTE